MRWAIRTLGIGRRHLVVFIQLHGIGFLSAGNHLILTAINGGGGDGVGLNDARRKFAQNQLHAVESPRGPEAIHLRGGKVAVVEIREGGRSAHFRKS